MKKYVLILSFCLTGCTLNEFLEIQNDPAEILELPIFQKEVKLDHGKVTGELMGKRRLGDKQICYYSIGDTKSIDGFSLVMDTCPTTFTRER